MADRSARIARRSSLAIVLGVLAVVAACWLASIGTSEASKDAKPQIDRQITSPIQATNGKIYFDSDRDGHAQIYRSLLVSRRRVVADSFDVESAFHRFVIRPDIAAGSRDQ